jgi:hypothetical protein
MVWIDWFLLYLIIAMLVYACLFPPWGERL